MLLTHMPLTSPRFRSHDILNVATNWVPRASPLNTCFSRSPSSNQFNPQLLFVTARFTFPYLRVPICDLSTVQWPPHHPPHPPAPSVCCTCVSANTRTAEGMN